MLHDAGQGTIDYHALAQGCANLDVPQVDFTQFAGINFLSSGPLDYWPKPATAT